MNNLINRIINRLKITYTDTFLVTPYRLSSFFNKSYGLYKGPPREKKLVVSLTSYPPRFPYLHICLESLLTQSVKPDMIVLWIYKGDMELLPGSVLKLKKRGITIKKTPEDLKQFKRTYYAFQEHKNHCIILCDDEIIYPSWFIKDIYNKWKKYPECISAYRTLDIIKTGAQSLAPYDTWPFSTETNPSLKLLPIGTGGILYPPGSLSDMVFDTGLRQKLSPTSDDCWNKTCSLLNNTKVIQVNKKIMDFPIIYYRKTQKHALWQNDTVSGTKDKYYKNTFDYFGLYEKI